MFEGWAVPVTSLNLENKKMPMRHAHFKNGHAVEKEELGVDWVGVWLHTKLPSYGRCHIIQSIWILWIGMVDDLIDKNSTANILYWKTYTMDLPFSRAPRRILILYD